MAEIREAALAYYYRFSEEQKLEAHSAFQGIDSNRDGTISINEYERIFGCSYSSIFRELDENGDGRLDYEEFITLYYLIKGGRRIFCQGLGCQVLLRGLYFTCLNCFDYNNATTFDLCSSCCRYGKYTHIHANFVDNYVLLRSKPICATPAALPVPPSKVTEALKATDGNGTTDDTAVKPFDSDAIVMSSDAVVTAADAVVMSSDAVLTASDAAVTAFEVVVTATDATVTFSDDVVTATDAAVTISDAIVSTTDATVTASDAVVTAVDVVVTAVDVAATAANVANAAAPIIDGGTKLLEVLDAIVTVGNLAASAGCTIM